ncbi:DedA family protein [Nesterenkonia lutea]|uniref:Membrane protein DedA with SNARE-associated domain n=1 Tax=Nesterenkonia lutea TaxID=272919 RepID=A0ABR9JB71_9MICC|nr:VTT domain-containing protein [Nesterenkonia lutea]MBE1523178.1 membrane protein DedA with SNARE-associated domain [Nesterenkonia lutea]
MTNAVIALGVNDLGDPALYQEWGFYYFIVLAVAVAFTAIVPPFPSEVMVIASGTMAAEDIFPLLLVLGVTFIGCLAGDVGVYLLFRYKLIRLLYRWKWGRRLHRKMVRISIRAGGATTWAGLLLIRGIPGGRSASMATAGIMRLGGSAIVALTLLGALTWSLWLVGLGYITGTTTGLPPWASTGAAIVVGTLVGLGITVLMTRHRSRRRTGRRPSAK